MMPFDNYPKRGRSLIGMQKGSNARHDYGLELQKISGQNSCAYCGTSLTDCYEHWLTLVTDHVIPIKEGKKIGIGDDWLYDYSNMVLCCSACNGFDNRFKLPEGTKHPKTLNDFFKLRNKIFKIRKKKILGKHREERKFFNQKPWRK